MSTTAQLEGSNQDSIFGRQCAPPPVEIGQRAPGRDIAPVIGRISQQTGTGVCAMRVVRATQPPPPHPHTHLSALSDIEDQITGIGGKGKNRASNIKEYYTELSKDFCFVTKSVHAIHGIHGYLSSFPRG